MNSASTSPQKKSPGLFDQTSPSFPKIWRTLTIRNYNTREIYNIRIQDITSDRYDEIWDMFMEHYLPDEPVHRSMNMSAEKENLSLAKRLFYRSFSDNLSLMAVLDNEDAKPTIVGGLLLKILSKNDPPSGKSTGKSIVTTPPMNPVVKTYDRKLNRVYTWMRIDNLFEILKIGHFLKENGLVVKREYRRMGIGLELFRTVQCIAKALDYPALAVIFTHPASKKIGATLGMKLLHEGRLVDCVYESGEKVFPDADPELQILSGYIKYGI